MLWCFYCFFSCLSVLGVGVLSLPYALKNVGIITGLFLLLLVGCGTISSYTLLLKTKRLTGHASYESLSLYLFGPTVSNFIKCIIILGTIAALTAYLTIIADSSQKYLLDFLDPDSSLVGLVDKKIILALAMIIIVPLSLTKRIESLTWTSTLSLMPLFYLMGLLLVYFLNKDTSSEQDTPTSVPLFAPNFFVALPICTFAFSSQVGSIPIFAEMEQHYGATQSHMLKVAIISIGSSFFFYAVCGILGLLTFADAVHPNIVLSFDKSPAVDVLLVSMIISVALGYPFSLFPCRDSIQSLLFPGHRESRRRTVILTLIIVAISYSIASFVSLTLDRERSLSKVAPFRP
jgi:solute carrier family 38 (sodium-coupled neutral amino acid transporter), member 11